MSKIKITSEQARIRYPRTKDNLGSIATILRSQLLMIVEDAFVLSKNKDRMDDKLKREWEYFRRILENRL